jgi:acyl-CoA synthetase (AMP-forming)/AMP-acid ligase II
MTHAGRGTRQVNRTCQSTVHMALMCAREDRIRKRIQATRQRTTSVMDDEEAARLREGNELVRSFNEQVISEFRASKGSWAGLVESSTAITDRNRALTQDAKVATGAREQGSTPHGRPNILLPGEILRRSARLYWSRPAVIAHGQTQTFGELYDRSCRLANALLSHGLCPGDRVAILGDNSIRSLEQIAAIAVANLVRCPLSAGSAAEAQVHALNDVAASALIVDRRYLDGLKGHLERVESLQLILVADDQDYEHLLAAYQATLPVVTAEEDDIHIIRFSSGSTGRAKGIAHTTRGWLQMGDEYFAMGVVKDEAERYLAAGPISHACGLIVWPLISAGGCHVLIGTFDVGRFLDAVEQHLCSIAFVVPTMIQAILADPRSWERDLSSLRVLGYGGAPISSSTVRSALKLWGNVLYQLYGQSEALPITVLYPGDHVGSGESVDLVHLHSAGRPAPHSYVVILDGAGNERPVGEVGEIAAFTPGNMAAVWGDPEATRDRVTPLGYIRTGDIGYLDEDGFLYLLDRKDDTIISGGFNIWPVEIENCLLAHPDIREASVFAVPHPKWGETPLATVVARPGSTLTEDALISWCRDRLGSVKRPTKVVFSDLPLPLDSGGKVRRRVLQQPYWAGRKRHVGEV